MEIDLKLIKRKQAVEHIVFSMISHYRSCKRMLTLVVNSGVYDTAVTMLKNKLENLKVDDASNKNADIVRVNKEYWRGIDAYVKAAERYGKISRLGVQNEPMNPIVNELYDDALSQDGITNVLRRENMFAYINVIKGDEKVAVETTGLMGLHLPKKKILEFSIFFQRIVK
ncbi:MAG: hypothetical protein QXK37_00250 [Candidatus Woesearchaeota archaeon]